VVLIADGRLRLALPSGCPHFIRTHSALDIRPHNFRPRARRPAPPLILLSNSNESLVGQNVRLGCQMPGVNRFGPFPTGWRRPADIAVGIPPADRSIAHSNSAIRVLRSASVSGVEGGGGSRNTASATIAITSRKPKVSPTMRAAIARLIHAIIAGRVAALHQAGALGVRAA
jgi:hypothetical protein